MKTTAESLEAAKSKVIEIVSALPDSGEGFDDDWQPITEDYTEIKKEIISAVKRVTTFTPAFTPMQNIKHHASLSEKAWALLTNNVPN